MKIYIGNCSEVFNCDNLLSEIAEHEVDPSHGHMQLISGDLYYEEYLKQTSMLVEAGYDDKSVEYRHYQGGVHFDSSYVDLFSSLVNAKTMMCWISEIRPGKCTPWHWDINPWEEEHKAHGEIVRYFCFLSKPQPGHIFVTEDDAYYNEPQGSVYQYKDPHSWHAGANVGLTPKFLMTFTGTK